MSKISLKNNICVVAKVSTKFKNYLDYYVLIPKRGYRYAFSKSIRKVVIIYVNHRYYLIKYCTIEVMTHL